MFWVFKKYIFPFSAMLWMTTSKQIAGKARQNNRKFLYPKVIIKSILKDKFQAILKSKMNGKSKMAFSTFLLIFKWPSWDLFFQKARQNNQNCINPKLIIGSVFKNGFEPTMRPKQMLIVLQIDIFTYLKDFEWLQWNCFLGKLKWFKKYLRLTLVFMRNSRLWEKFNICFPRVFC